jgi:hypothetical protein
VARRLRGRPHGAGVTTVPRRGPVVEATRSTPSSVPSRDRPVGAVRYSSTCVTFAGRRSGGRRTRTPDGRSDTLCRRPNLLRVSAWDDEIVCNYQCRKSREGRPPISDVGLRHRREGTNRESAENRLAAERGVRFDRFRRLESVARGEERTPTREGEAPSRTALTGVSGTAVVACDAARVRSDCVSRDGTQNRLHPTRENPVGVATARRTGVSRRTGAAEGRALRDGHFI